MKRMKMAVAWVCALLICLSVMPVSAQTEATVSAASAFAEPGSTIQIPISVTRVEEAVSIGMHVWYDPAVLKCVDAQMSATVQSMTMANANTEPLNHPNEVWLTAIGTSPVVLEGEVMTITFEVLSNAPMGTSPVKVLQEGLSISERTDLRALRVAGLDGSVTVVGDASDIPAQITTTSASKTPDQGFTTTVTDTNVVGTTVQSVTNDAPVQSTDAPYGTTTTMNNIDNNDNVGNTDNSGNNNNVGNVGNTHSSPNNIGTNEKPITQPDGEVVELPEETVVDIQGNIVTDASGNPAKVKAVAIMFDEITASPEETITVNVSLSAVADLTAIGIGVHYDTNALAFEGGECVGFVKDGMSMTAVKENKSGVVDISAMGGGVSGSGAIAQLRFKVKNTAKNGAYRLSAEGTPLLQTREIELPVKVIAGKIHVEGAAENTANGLPIAIGAVAVAAVAAAIVWLVLRRKKAAPSAPKASEAPVVNVSGEDEE